MCNNIWKSKYILYIASEAAHNGSAELIKPATSSLIPPLRMNEEGLVVVTTADNMPGSRLSGSSSDEPSSSDDNSMMDDGSYDFDHGFYYEFDEMFT